MSARWFSDSGIMAPPDGSWGVAERILLTAGNSAVQRVYESFPAWSECAGYSIIEQRRADCNLETAFLQLLWAEQHLAPGAAATAVNLLHYLYCRSGLLARSPRDSRIPRGVWNWSHIRWTPALWFDDNSWMCLLSLMIARMHPELDRRFALREWALLLARALAEGMEQSFPVDEHSLPAPPWSGHLRLPHWGSLVVMALCRAAAECPLPEAAALTDRYHEWILARQEQFTASEYAYAVLGSAMAARVRGDRLSCDTARCFSDRLLALIDPVTGNLPSQHFETPSGGHLVDLIYTVNWALPALQCSAALFDDARYRAAAERLLRLVLEIQDRSPEAHLGGCWRGMYDLNAGGWGGGDCYEGGANSIYSGWTNAPLGWAVAGHLSGRTLIDY